MHKNYDQPQVALHANKHKRFFKFKFSRNKEFIVNVVKVRCHIQSGCLLDNTIKIVLTLTIYLVDIDHHGSKFKNYQIGDRLPNCWGWCHGYEP